MPPNDAARRRKEKVFMAQSVATHALEFKPHKKSPTPTSKPQRKPKFQDQKAGPFWFGSYWCLKVGVCLEFGIWIFDFCQRFALAPAGGTRYRVGRVRPRQHPGSHRGQSLVAAVFCQTGAQPGRETAGGGGV